jgi:hypothetical protein
VHAGDDLVVGGGADEVDHVQRYAEAVEMAVGVDEAGEDGGPGHIDHARVRIFCTERRGRTNLAYEVRADQDCVVLLRRL